MLWAITCYFNPQGYRNRLRNYRLFRKRLNLPLVAVELSYGDSFDLTAADADILVQLRGTDLMWQKERLLNLAAAELPAECDKVVWLDADVVLENPAWAETTSRLLEEHPVVQPFDSVLDLQCGQTPRSDIEYNPLDLARSLGCGLAEGHTVREQFENQLAQLKATGGAHRYLGAGNGWAARREILERTGLYDGCVLGGGNLAIVAAADGDFPLMQLRTHATTRHYEHFCQWAERFHAEVCGNVGYTPGRLFHLWHGDLPSRRYAERHRIMRTHDYDPFRDIALDDIGCWRWNSGKPELHQAVRDYFAGRHEEDPRLVATGDFA